ncbi:alpha/beta fold hydrolase [Vibrio sp. ZSDZ34]|jgi:esterase|uniref:Alpha/beta fold hydrolase n=1 Tax=Vibrio gelatinilyticus TaxID=2893468 RepID=A0A9X2AUA7_9VIBR|nr:alpha/beta fold hydrolase [Vibrio gelatinilyticus]MCJ2375759.1 alpha/beta fold hydrolase [Vibrio gelatinilyticus]
MSVLLNYKIEGAGQPVVLLHGLFGDMNNLGVLARELKDQYQVVSVDLRNHGRSFHDEQHNYQAMASDVALLLNNLSIEQPIVIGHSMGGKVAMKLTEHNDINIDKLIVLDMSPVHYAESRHDNVFAGLNNVSSQRPTSRAQAMQLLSEDIETEGVRQFLSKSLTKRDDHLVWRFNVETLQNRYHDILGWSPIKPTDVATLFVKGSLSDYILAEHQTQIQAQFSHAKAHIIANTGHWLHAEKPEEVLRAIRKFLA